MIYYGLSLLFLWLCFCFINLLFLLYPFYFSQLEGDLLQSLSVLPSFISDQNDCHLRNIKNRIQIPSTPCIRSYFDPLMASHFLWNKFPKVRRCYSFRLFKQKLLIFFWRLRNYFNLFIYFSIFSFCWNLFNQFNVFSL